MSAGERPPASGRHQAHDQPVGELFGELTDELRVLFRQEVELAKVELKQEATRAGKASGKLAAGGVVGLMGWLLLSFAFAWALALVLPTWAGFAILGVVYVVIAAVLGASGRKQLQKFEPSPDRAVAEAKETKQWLQDRT